MPGEVGTRAATASVADARAAADTAAAAFPKWSAIGPSERRARQQLVRDAVGKGGKVLCGGARVDGTIMKGIVVDR
jgi:acyl-CoA reductase-like NAD-dependent aldehyde dehydrogenase